MWVFHSCFFSNSLAINKSLGNVVKLPRVFANTTPTHFQKVNPQRASCPPLKSTPLHVTATRSLVTRLLVRGSPTAHPLLSGMHVTGSPVRRSGFNQNRRHYYPDLMMSLVFSWRWPPRFTAPGIDEGGGQRKPDVVIILRSDFLDGKSLTNNEGVAFFFQVPLPGLCQAICNVYRIERVERWNSCNKTYSRLMYV